MRAWVTPFLARLAGCVARLHRHASRKALSRPLPSISLCRFPPGGAVDIIAAARSVTSLAGSGGRPIIVEKQARRGRRDRLAGFGEIAARRLHRLDPGRGGTCAQSVFLF